jgi:8-oxo-dGTP pyrophosphatase MutT (NUDIX family)
MGGCYQISIHHRQQLSVAGGSDPYNSGMRSRGVKRAAGVVVVRDTADGQRFLLLRAYRNWDLPKGGLEPDETPLQAAVREAREETGLSDLEFRWGEDYIETEPYAGGKVVRFYLARSPAGVVSLPINPALGRAEHHEFRWVSLETALLLTVPRLQRVLQWAAARLAEPVPADV